MQIVCLVKKTKTDIDFVFGGFCRERAGDPGGEHGGLLPAHGDGERPAEGLPGHAQLHRRPTGDRRREREAGTAAAVGPAAARGRRDEGRPHGPRRRAVPQDLHPAARECQHPLCRYRRLHRPGVAVHRPGAGPPPQRTLRTIRSARQRQLLPIAFFISIL